MAAQDDVFHLGEYRDAIDSASSNGRPCVVATCGMDGPDIGFKGSMLVWDDERLAYWERTRGQHLENLRRNPEVAVLYQDLAQGTYLRFFGRATLHEDGEMRQRVMGQINEQELEMDAERRGIAVIIDVHTVSDPFGRGTLQSESASRIDPEQRKLDKQVEDSFPASDPPSTTPVQGVGAPDGGGGA